MTEVKQGSATDRAPEVEGRGAEASGVRWYKTAYRRNVVDMHIMDWDERFLSRFDPKTYVATLLKSQAQSAVLYAHSHTGLTYYPTRHGCMHRGIGGRNIYAETAAECREHGIAVQLYFSLIFDTWAYRTHPDWRIRNADGTGVGDSSRYGVCCPNSPYGDYTARMVEEICDTLEFDGIRFDMTFWPSVCYCIHCRNRFHREVGGEIPTVIDWDDPAWVAFQRKREDWLVEFAERMTSTVHRLRPGASVEHQASTLTLFWRFGVTWRLAGQNTFLQGDFYDDILQGSVARKVFSNLSEELPFGFETSFNVELKNHTVKKDENWLRCKAYAALADGGAFVFIDAIDPVGTLNPATYDTMGRIFGETRRYEPFVGGERLQDVVLYLSTESKYNPLENGLSLLRQAGDTTNQGLSRNLPHVDALFSAANALIRNHIPFGIITKRNIADLDRFKVVVLPDVLVMDDEEVHALREYVRRGGRLYASKRSSLQGKDGSRPGDFMLGDVFGVSCRGETAERFTYLAPEDGLNRVFGDFTTEHPLGLDQSQVRVALLPGAQAWARTVLPYTHPDAWDRFASIHSNPPGIPTDDPAVVWNRFGEGACIYSAASLETPRVLDGIFVNLIRCLHDDFSFGVEAPPAVEATAFWQAEFQRHALCLLNFQKELPNVPVDGARVSLRTDGRTCTRVRLLPEGDDLPFTVDGGRVVFTSPTIETFRMFLVEYA